MRLKLRRISARGLRGNHPPNQRHLCYQMPCWLGQRRKRRCHLAGACGVLPVFWRCCRFLLQTASGVFSSGCGSGGSSGASPLMSSSDKKDNRSSISLLSGSSRSGDSMVYPGISVPLMQKCFLSFSGMGGEISVNRCEYALMRP